MPCVYYVRSGVPSAVNIRNYSFLGNNTMWFGRKVQNFTGTCFPLLQA